jgi:hypothetical protein
MIIQALCMSEVALHLHVIAPQVFPKIVPLASFAFRSTPETEQTEQQGAEWYGATLHGPQLPGRSCFG